MKPNGQTVVVSTDRPEVTEVSLKLTSLDSDVTEGTTINIVVVPIVCESNCRYK